MAGLSDAERRALVSALAIVVANLSNNEELTGFDPLGAED